MMPPFELLDRITAAYLQLLQNRLVGIYLHGSLAMGCYTAETGDMDLLVVVSDPLSAAEARAMVDVLLILDVHAPSKGIEVSVLLERDCAAFHHPMPFLLHFSNMHKERYRTDPEYLCGGFEDPDLAAHVTVTLAHGRCLYGKPISEVFSAVPEADFLDSVLSDISVAVEEIVQDPVYHGLNLCRVLAYLKDGAVLSKKEGGEWAIQNLTDRSEQHLVGMLLTGYQGDCRCVHAGVPQIEAFAKKMLQWIQAAMQSRM